MVGWKWYTFLINFNRKVKSIIFQAINVWYSRSYLTLKSKKIIWITEDGWILLFYFVSCKFVLFRFYLFRPLPFLFVSPSSVSICFALFRFYLFRPVPFQLGFDVPLTGLGTDQWIVFTEFAWGLITLLITYDWSCPDYYPRMSFNQSPRLPTMGQWPVDLLLKIKDSQNIFPETTKLTEISLYMYDHCTHHWIVLWLAYVYAWSLD